jgi:hypothetical protein
MPTLPFSRLTPLLACLATALLTGCATTPETSQFPSLSAPTTAAPLEKKGENYHYVVRPITEAKTADSDKPYWLTRLAASSIQTRVLPTNSGGASILLRGDIAVPQILLQKVSETSGRVHMRIINRAGTPLPVTVLMRETASTKWDVLNVNVDIAPSYMADFAVEVPVSATDNLVIAVQ